MQHKAIANLQAYLIGNIQILLVTNLFACLRWLVNTEITLLCKI